MIRYLFRKSQRLKTNEQFRAVLSRKCWVGNDLARLYVAGNTVGYPRLGVSVGKKYGNAVARNRLKRLCREVFRLEQHNIPTGYDYLLIFSPKLTKKGTAQGVQARGAIRFEQLRTWLLDFTARGAGKCGRGRAK